MPHQLDIPTNNLRAGSSLVLSNYYFTVARMLPIESVSEYNDGRLAKVRKYKLKFIAILFCGFSTTFSLSSQDLPAYSQFKKNRHHLKVEVNNRCAKHFIQKNLAFTCYFQLIHPLTFYELLLNQGPFCGHFSIRRHLRATTD